MKPVGFACLAMLMFVFVSVVIEQKLSTYTTAALMVYVYLVTLPLALGTVGFLKLTNQPVVVPTGSVIILTSAVGAGYYLGDLFFFSAYANGGTVAMVGNRYIAVSGAGFARQVRVDRILAQRLSGRELCVGIRRSRTRS